MKRPRKFLMETLVVFTVLGLLSMSVQAQNTQQEKMKTCNAQAKTQSLSGDARTTALAAE